MGIAIGDGRTSPTEAKELAPTAFLELLILTVFLHLRPGPEFVERSFPHVADDAVEPPTGHHVAIGADGEMAVPAVAAVVNEVLIQPFRNLEQTVLIEVQRPQMVLEVEIRS